MQIHTNIVIEISHVISFVAMVIYKIESDRYMTYEINKSEGHYIPLL